MCDGRRHHTQGATGSLAGLVEHWVQPLLQLSQHPLLSPVVLPFFLLFTGQWDSQWGASFPAHSPGSIRSAVLCAHITQVFDGKDI